MRKSALTLLVFAFLASGAYAGAMDLDRSASAVEWTAKKVTGQHHGTIDIKSGSFETDANGRITGGTVEIDMASLKDLDLTDPQDNAKLTHHLKSEDFFNADKWPTAKFVLKSITMKDKAPQGDASKAGWQKAVVTGDLTIKDVTNPISFPAKIKMSKDGAEATAEVKVDRTKWNIRYRSGKFFPGLGDHLIYDVFTMNLKLKAKKS